jgi:hypothetical protein
VPLPPIKEEAVQHQQGRRPEVHLRQAEVIVPPQPEAARRAAPIRHLAEVLPVVLPVHQEAPAQEVHLAAALPEAEVEDNLFRISDRQ